MLPLIATGGCLIVAIFMYVVYFKRKKSESTITRNFSICGQYTPTKFARADVFDKSTNPKPIIPVEQIKSLKAGPSDIKRAELISVQQYNHDSPQPFLKFLAIMEAQWEGRDTQNASIADAVVGFAKYNPEKDVTERKHDGTKSTLNIFAHGRYAHPLEDKNEFDIKPDHRSEGIVVLDEDNYVGYKVFRQKKNLEMNSIDYARNWEETSNGRFKHIPNDEEGINSDWKQKMRDMAQKQQEIGQKGVPILVLFGIDLATKEQLDKLKDVTTAFLDEIKPDNLMLSGKRDKKIADRAEEVMNHFLAKRKSKINLITGCADGVDSIPLRIAGYIA